MTQRPDHRNFLQRKALPRFAFAVKFCSVIFLPGLATWVLAQGVEFKTNDSVTDQQRLKIDTSAVGVDANAYFMKSKVGIGTATPGARLDVTDTNTVGIRYLKTGSRDARIEVGDPTQTWSFAAGTTTAGDFSLNEEGTSNDRFYVQRTTGYVGLGTSTPGARLEVVGSGTGLMFGWNEAIRLNPAAHAAITHPGGNILFGLHGNRNFYWADMTNGWYSAILDPTGELTLRDKLLINGTDNGWGNTVINGRVWSASSNIHLSPPAGANVYVEDTYREAGGAGGGTAGLIVEGVTQCNDGIAVDGSTVVDNGAGWHRTYGNTGWYNGTYGGGWWMTDGSWIRTYGGNNMLISNGNWAGLFIENTGGRNVSLENNAGMVGGGGLRIWDQSGAGQIADLQGDGTLQIGGNAMHYDAGAGGVRMRSGSYGNGNTTGNQLWVNWNGGSFQFYVDGGVQKNFIIDHPVDAKKYLIHTTLEGPESAVFYRGTARLAGGKAEIVLPAYFEALTREEGRTVLVTPEFENFDDAVSALAPTGVRDGKFRVRALDGANPDQKFSWEVKAVRKDVSPLLVEPDRDEVEVRGIGPYKYYDVKQTKVSLYPE